MRCGNNKSHQEIQIRRIAKTNTPAKIRVLVIFSVAHPLKIPKTCLSSSFRSRCYNSTASQEIIVKTIKPKLAGNQLSMISKRLLSATIWFQQVDEEVGLSVNCIYFVSNKAQYGNLHSGRMVLNPLNLHQTLNISSSWEQESHRKLL